MRDVVDRCLEDLATSGRSTGRDLAATLAAEPVIVHADPDRLQQVVTNLVDNALKYTPANGAIRVSVGHDADEAVIAVKDTGIGIAPEVLPHVFDIFRQAEEHRHTGLGLGLALVRALVEQHGGTVSAQSLGVGLGSAFVVRLPLQPDLVVAEPEMPAIPRERSRRILIIEDNADARNTLRTLLEIEGHRVEVAAEGEDGVRLARVFQPNIAVVDIGLPDIDGYQVARRLRSLAPPGRMYLVALSGYGQPEDRRRALESGFDAHLVKPVEPDRFLHALDIPD